MAQEVDAPAPLRRGECAIEDRQVLIRQPRRALDRIVRVDEIQDAPDLRLVVPEFAQRHRYRPVDDLEHPPAGQLLIFHQGNIWLNSSSVTIHHECYSTSWRQDRDLAVAIAMLS